MTYRISQDPFGRDLPPVKLLPHTVDVYRQSDVKIRQDDGGMVPQALRNCTPAALRVPCWVQPATPNEILESQRLNLTITHTITFYQDPIVTNGDYALFQGTRVLNIYGKVDGLEVGRVWVLTAKEIN